MNSFQRAWRSMFRKPVKSGLLLLVIVTVSLSLLCGMACQNASVQTQDTTRQAVGAGLRLDGNESNRTKRLEETTDKITHQPGYLDEGELDGVYIRKLETAYGTQWYVGADNSFDSLLMDDIEKLAAVPGISDYNVTTKSHQSILSTLHGSKIPIMTSITILVASPCWETEKWNWISMFCPAM